MKNMVILRPFLFMPGNDHYFDHFDHGVAFRNDLNSDVTAFKALTLYGHKGLVLSKFYKYNYFRRFIDSQWYVFVKEKAYDPITGQLCWSLGANVWTWGASYNWIRDSRILPWYSRTFGVAGRRLSAVSATRLCSFGATPAKYPFAFRAV